MKNTKFKVLRILLAALLVSLCFTSVLTACDTEYDLTVFTSHPLYSRDYHVDESGNFIADIPFDEYLSDDAADDSQAVFDIRDYGASTSADFKTNREAINSAIIAANASGGGVVLVDGGEYSCANIQLLSNVTLRIAKDSALVNITYDQDINENAGFNDSTGDNVTVRNGFIYAENAQNIVIEGPGKLKGNGATYCLPQEDSTIFAPLDTFHLKTYVLEHRKRIMMGKTHEMSRYFIMAINYCQNVTVRNLEIYEAGSWTCRMEGNDNLLFEDVVINNNFRVANTDGIDIMGGTDTTIRHCFIATGDDAICLKTDPGNQPVDGVTVEDCEIMSLANCFKTGTATHNDIKNVSIKDCYFFMPDGVAGGYAGIAIEATDGGAVSNISVDNVYMNNVTSPLLVWLGYRGDGSSLKNVSISNITSWDCDIASAITGYEKASVDTVSIKNFNVKYREAKESLDIYQGNSDYCGRSNMGGYPEITRVSHSYRLSHETSEYWDMSVYGLLVRYADNVTTEGVYIVPRSTNTRPVSNIELG